MTAYNPDGNIDFLQRDDDTVSHFPVVGLQQIFARCAGRAEPGPIVENSPVAAVSRVPDRIVWSLRLRNFSVMCRQEGVTIDRGTEHHTWVECQHRLLNRRQNAITKFDE